MNQWKMICLAVLSALLLSIPIHAQSIPMDSVTVIGSPDVRSFDSTHVSLDSITFTGSAMILRSTGASAWPSVAIEPGGEPVQAGTLWVIENIQGKWYATGAERLRPSQVSGSKPEGSPADLIGTGFLYAEDRWGPMAGYNPVEGELVGFMIVSGSTRSDDQVTVQQRSPAILTRWSRVGSNYPLPIVWREGDPLVSTQPTQLPVQPPTQVPGDDTLRVRLDHLGSAYADLAIRVGLIEHSALQSEAGVATLYDLIKELGARVIPASCVASANLGAFRIPISCSLK